MEDWRQWYRDNPPIRYVPPPITPATYVRWRPDMERLVALRDWARVQVEMLPRAEGG